MGEVQLLLMEVEEYHLAANAGQLKEGLLGFDLLSNTYRPVYDALNGFAARLPVDGTTNAQVVGRLMNNIKMGYYPTDPDNISLILKGVQFPEGVTTNPPERAASGHFANHCTRPGRRQGRCFGAAPPWPGTAPWPG